MSLDSNTMSFQYKLNKNIYIDVSPIFEFLDLKDILLVRRANRKFNQAAVKAIQSNVDSFKLVPI